jgi:putative RecB family exonuclease
MPTDSNLKTEPYSHSRLETYRNCPWQFKLQYIDKIEVEEAETVEAFLGSRVHEVLEKLYKDMRMAKIPTLDDLLAHYDHLYGQNWHEGVKIVRTDYGPENYRELGRRYITEYYNRYHPFDQARTIALEQRVSVKISDEEGKEYTIRGVIDRLSVAEDGTYEIHDYKTSGRLPTQEEVDKDRQLALYHIAVQGMWEDVGDVELVWHYLAFGKELRSRRTAGELEGLRGDIIRLIREIERDTAFQPRESALCDWCPYPELCPAKKHGLLTAGLPVNEYLKEPGVNLVNRFADLHRQKQEIEGEIAQVKEALIHYAKDKDVQVVKGSNHRVLVRFYKGLAFPTKDHPGRKELERVVKELGLWESVTVLSPVSLAKLVERGGLDSETAQQISRLGWQEERPWVKLAQLRRGYNSS